MSPIVVIGYLLSVSMVVVALFVHLYFVVLCTRCVYQSCTFFQELKITETFGQGATANPWKKNQRIIYDGQRLSTIVEEPNEFSFVEEV